jgi:dTDP-4-dehydrorhamnose 3,5-epimerase
MSDPITADPAPDAMRSRYELADEVEPSGQPDGPTVDSSGRRLSTGIEGVVYSRAVTHVDHRGTLTEALNFDDDFWDEAVVYAYHVTIRPGMIKGWGMHRKQADRYLVLAGSLRVVLHDARVRSPTYREFAQFDFSEVSPGRLLIPPGVWHADQNWGRTDALLINFPTRAYEHAAPDKHRIDPHSGVIPFDFALADG